MSINKLSRGSLHILVNIHFKSWVYNPNRDANIFIEDISWFFHNLTWEHILRIDAGIEKLSCPVIIIDILWRGENETKYFLHELLKTKDEI